MSDIKRLFHSLNDGGTGRAGVLQIPVTESQRDVLSPAIADIAEATANTKSGVMLRYLYDGAIGADDYEGACIEDVYRDAPRLSSSTLYPEKIGVCRGISSYIESALSYANSKGTPTATDADNLLRPMVRFFATCAKNRQLRLHHPIDEWDPRFNIENRYSQILFDAIEQEGGHVPPEARNAAKREGCPHVRPLVDIVLENWGTCRKMGDYTFRYVFYLAEATDNWDDTVSERLLFAETCRAAYRWRKQSELVGQKNQAQPDGSPALIRHNLKDEDYVVVPMRYQPVNPQEAAECQYAGLIEVANPSAPNTPSFVFFSRKETDALSDSEIDAIIASASEKWANGSLLEIRNAEISLETDRAGRPVNLEQYLSHPRVVLSPIEEVAVSRSSASLSESMIFRQ